MGEHDRAARDAHWRAKHTEQVRDTIDRGDPREIKQLYVDMGTLLEASYGDDAANTPLLSLSETVPVVTALLAEVDGVLLDAGCGPHPAASIALAKARPSRTIVAIDLGGGTVRLALARASSDGVTLLGVVGDLEALPFRDGAVRGVVSDDTVEHVPDDRRAVAELLRVTRGGAPVVIATPNRRSASVVARKVRDRVRGRRRPASSYYAAESHLREYTRRELDALVAGLAVIDRRATVGWSGGGARRALTAVTSVGPLKRFGRMLVVRLRSG